MGVAELCAIEATTGAEAIYLPSGTTKQGTGTSSDGATYGNVIGSTNNEGRGAQVSFIMSSVVRYVNGYVGFISLVNITIKYTGSPVMVSRIARVIPSMIPNGNQQPNTAHAQQ